MYNIRVGYGETYTFENWHDTQTFAELVLSHMDGTAKIEIRPVTEDEEKED